MYHILLLSFLGSSTIVCSQSCRDLGYTRFRLYLVNVNCKPLKDIEICKGSSVQPEYRNKDRALSPHAKARSKL
jgi:hypothetical protein